MTASSEYGGFVDWSRSSLEEDPLDTAEMRDNVMNSLLHAYDGNFQHRSSSVIKDGGFAVNPKGWSSTQWSLVGSVGMSLHVRPDGLTAPLVCAVGVRQIDDDGGSGQSWIRAVIAPPHRSLGGVADPFPTGGEAPVRASEVTVSGTATQWLDFPDHLQLGGEDVRMAKRRMNVPLTSGGALTTSTLVLAMITFWVKTQILPGQDTPPGIVGFVAKEFVGG